jgi:hypothetical protein
MVRASAQLEGQGHSLAAAVPLELLSFTKLFLTKMNAAAHHLLTLLLVYAENEPFSFGAALEWERRKLKTALQNGRETSLFLSDLRYASRSGGRCIYLLARRTSRLRPWMQPRWEAFSVQKIHNPMPHLLKRGHRLRTLALVSAANRLG